MPEYPPTVKGATDEELISAFQQGDATAFGVIVGRYKDRLVNFVFRYVGDYDDADDIVQETFVRVYRSRDLYQPVAKFSTWIYTIATNLAKTELRRRRYRMLVPLSRKSEHDAGRDVEIADARYPADDTAERSLQQEFIQRALNAIPAKYRELVVLCDIQELSYDEICAVTGLNVGTVKSRLNRGRAQLQKLLKDLIDE
ncbi:MAG: sigma-70 family RNA polymerase sigma factor [Bacteroidota bacterium]|jgi:RNA polymerase sigma-70 factor (ECF subfamily)